VEREIIKKNINTKLVGTVVEGGKNVFRINFNRHQTQSGLDLYGGGANQLTPIGRVLMAGTGMMTLCRADGWVDQNGRSVGGKDGFYGRLNCVQLQARKRFKVKPCRGTSHPEKCVTDGGGFWGKKKKEVVRMTIGAERGGQPRGRGEGEVKKKYEIPS